MFDDPTPTVDRLALVQIVRQVRGRWRLKLLLRGAAGVLAGGLAGLALSAFALEWLKFSPAAIVTLRVTTSLLLAALVAGFLVWPLRRRVSDSQVALYLEEHEPSLESLLVSAVDISTAAPGGRPAAGPLQSSPALARRLIEDAVEKCQATRADRGAEASHLRRYGALLAGTALAGAALFLLGPAYLRQGVSALLLVSRSVEAASPYRIDVRPGNATVPRGSDQTIAARLVGFESEQVELLVRRTPGAPFERWPMVASADSGAYEGMLFDLPGPVDYFVQSAGVRSPRFSLQVADVPYVKRLQLEYRFPAYTGLPPRTIENGGDIAVLEGTEVRLRIVPTIPTAAGRLLLHGTDAVALALEGDTLTGRFVVDRSGFYRIELETPQRNLVAASPQYAIDALQDLPPSVSFAKPGRDETATPLEEFYVQARADDDFGVRDLQLVYSINGGPAQTKTLLGATDRALPEVSAGYTFYLEELGVSAGDSVSYYARAADNDRVGAPNSTTSDLYFLRIRPFDQDFRAALSMAGGGGGAGGGAGEQVDALSQQQRQIIAATFNVVRDRKTLSASQLRENLVVLSLAQARLREQVEGLVARMNSELVEPDPKFSKIAGTMPKAAVEMRAGEARLKAQEPEAALAPEQRALTLLQQAEEEYELQVGMNRGGGGGGGGAGSIAQDLAGLFEQELDKMASQYETTQRAEQQGRDRQVDELMERLRELARRQEQEADRQRQRAAAGQTGAGGGASQRALADQAEEAARRLERLSREQGRTDMLETARRLQEAADAMRRAAASGDPSGAAQAGTALERLREAQRRLEREQGARGQREIQDALRQAEEIAGRQREMAQDVASLGQAGAGRPDRVQRLIEQKGDLESRVADLERQLDTTAGDLRRDQPGASRRLQEAAASIRDDKVKEKIHYSRSLIQGASPETARAMEDQIGANLEALRKKVGEAAAAVTGSPEDRMADALERARNLTRGVESLGERMRERAGQAQAGRPQQGQGSEQGQSARGSQAGSNRAKPANRARPGNRARPANRVKPGNRARPGSRVRPGKRAREAGTGTPAGGRATGPAHGDWTPAGAVGTGAPRGAATARMTSASSAARFASGPPTPSNCATGCATRTSTSRISTRSFARSARWTATASTRTPGNWRGCSPS